MIGVKARDYPQVLNRMRGAGMLGYMPVAERKGTITPFGRLKDGGLIRVLMDGRSVNEVMLPPPSDQGLKLRLPSPDVFRKVQMKKGVRYYISKIDLDSYFLSLLVPEFLHSWFCLPPVHSSFSRLASRGPPG